MALIILNNTKEYIEFDATDEIGETIFMMTQPTTNTSILRDRIVFMVSFNKNIAQDIRWSGTPILWENNDIPTVIGNINFPREIIKVEFWKNPTNDSWLGSYIKYNG